MPLSFPYSCWVGLAHQGSEVVGPGYARAPVTFVLLSDGATGANNAVIQWPLAAGPWGDIDTVSLWNAPAAGDPLGSFAIDGGFVQINQYDRAEIPPAAFEVAPSSGPAGFGTFTFGVGRYGTAIQDEFVPVGDPTLGSPYGAGPYGYGAYERLGQSVLLLKTWPPALLCNGEPADWAPHGPFEMA